MSKLKAIGLAIAMAVAPMMASAAVIQMIDGGVTPVTVGDTLYYAENGINGGADSRVFTLTSVPISQSNLAAEFTTLEFTGLFQGLSIQLTNNLGTFAASLIGPNANNTGDLYGLSTLFNAINGFTQTLSVTWTGINTASNGGNAAGLLIQAVPSAVPVPAAGFLMIGALGGLAALRRRRKTAAPAALAAV